MMNYLKIPFADNYSVNRDGLVINNTTNKPTTLWLNNKNNKWCTYLINNKGQRRTVSLAYILGLTFIAIPVELENKVPTIVHKDGNYSNHNLHNLGWVARKHFEDIRFKTRLQDNLIKFNVPLFKNDLDGNYPNAVECSCKAGYYFIPNSDHPVVINKEGIVFNLETNKKLNVYKTDSYPLISIRRNGVYKSPQIHRLLAKLFIPIPDRLKDINIESLEVNHLNGNKNDYALGNLEWCTTKENNKHAIDTGLSNFIRVLSKNILTNEIKVFSTAIDCARYYKITPGFFRTRLINGQAGQKTKNWHVFKFDDDKPWPPIKRELMIENSWEIFGGFWYCHKSNTNESFIETSLSRLCISIGVDIGRFEGINFLDNEPVTISNLCIYYSENPSIDDYRKVNPTATRKVLPRKSVKVVNLVTMEKNITSSLNEAARLTSVASKTLSDRLARGGGTASMYGYYYEFYQTQ